MTPPLYKTTLVIWSEYNPDAIELEIDDLARDAMTGEAYCSEQKTEFVANPKDDPTFPDTEFFDAG